MRVLHVLNELRSSGAEVGLQKASGFWKDFGIHCTILATGQERGSFAPDLERAGYEVRHLPFTGDATFLGAYVRLIRRHDFDVVHVHTERAFVYLCLAARMVGAGVVRTIRANFPFEGRLARRRSWQRRIARLAGTRFIAISASVAENEKLRFGNPTLQINNWIDTDYFRPPSVEERLRARRHFSVPEGSFAVVTVGNCAPVKNHLALLNALARVPDPWTWLHVGDEGAELSERIEAERLGVMERCRFVGRRDPLAALRAGDLYVMPSLYEGLGMATVEALSTGLPALLTDVPGNRDLAALGTATRLCTTDVPGVAEGLRDALLHPKRIDGAALAEQHELVASRYGVARGVSAYATVYADAVGSDTVRRRSNKGDGD
jgi:glycosyltransferase involved in cell wall biosynthesis